MRRTPHLAHTLAFVGAVALVAATFVSIAGADSPAPVPGDPLMGSGQVSRTLLTYSQLTTAQAPATPVNDDAFAVPAGAAMPDFTLAGTLTLQNPGIAGGFTNVAGCSKSCGKHLPPVTIDFVQSGSYLIPATQGLVITGDTQAGSTYNLIVGPGRAWKENSDTGGAVTFSRASFPFTLVDRNANCAHNGAMTFLYNETTVSNVRYQVTAETCVLYQFDMAGQLAATYAPHAITNSAALQSAQVAEIANRMPIRPLAALATDYPGAGINLSTFGRGITASTMTAYGVVYRGVNYVADASSATKGCATRFGTYAFCAEMRLPSYSTAKAAFAGLALARLTAKYGSGVLAATLRSTVPEMAASANWSSSPATLDNAADMATGNYSSQLYESDENGTKTTGFLTAEAFGSATTGKLGYALSYAPHPGQQGFTWVYHTVDHFLLTQGETGYLQGKAGPGADLFTLMRDEVYAPAHLTTGALTTERTDNASTQRSTPTAGRPWGAYGLFFTVDDVAKLATLYQNGGASDGVQLVDRNQVLAGMQRLTADTGVAAVTTDSTQNGDSTVSAGGWRYSNGLWAYPTTSQVPGCALRVPEMSGYGGITIAMMPNGATYYSFSDGGQFSWAQAIAELNKLSPMCAPTTATVTSNTASPAAGQPVTLTATVAAAARAWSPTGTVQFKDGGITIGPNVPLDGAGRASLTTSSLRAGTHTITAVYSPDLTNNTGTATSPARTTTVGTCGTTATTCTVRSTAGLKVGDTIAMGTTTQTNDTHVITALTATTISWIGAFQKTSHGDQPVWVQNTAGGGFAASTSPAFTQVVQ
ncbi:MAG: Ig-like domain-containing protein [Thermoleophilia bacterium]